MMSDGYRLDELARRAGVPSTTVRLYRTRGLLGPPRLEGRTGWYDRSHLRRLRLIARLQDQGHSLAGIGDLLARWEDGRSLDAVLGVEAGLDALLGDDHAVVIDRAELAARFPTASLTPDLVQRAGRLGLVEPLDDGRVRVPDRRFLETGATLAHLGLPLDAVLDEWEALVAHTDEIAARFIDRFDEHVAPDDWATDLDSDAARALAGDLASLRVAAHQVLAAALDASLARQGRERLGGLLEG